ncbi:NAD+ synthase [Rhodohalobacter sp. 8-1]|uniref:NAD+ synthase n=1 Tax=Rhodohalobacter sp. 8-1 TaxID=3131972 RepID=UPI0030EF5CCD
MKIRLHQLNPTIGDLEGNRNLILSALDGAESNGIDLLILPEMCVTGYPVQDLLERPSFRNAVYSITDELISGTTKTALLFGSLTANEEGSGRKMYNSAILARDGQEIGRIHKTLLPTYDVFDDLRYFEPNTEFDCLTLDGVKLGVTICEDIWYNENEFQYHHYMIDPAHKLADKGAEVIINISASPFTNTKHENRLHMLGKHASELELPVLYCNQVGAHTELVFDGGSLAMGANGKAIAHTRAFEESFTDVHFNQKDKSLQDSSSRGWYPESENERHFYAIKRGLKDYMEKTGVTDKVILGLSGGIDSALVAVLAVETLGAENVHAVTMSSEYSSEGSVADSVKLANNLGMTLSQIPIETIYDEFNATLDPLFKDLPFGVAEENLQSRIRGSLLMTISNKFNAFLLATGNKSEYAVGYATLYGDMNGAIAPIGDLYKTKVFELSEWLNKEYYKKEMIPEEILKKAPSAELRPDQKDSDTLPEYDILDSILFQYIERMKPLEEIADSGIDIDTVRSVVALVDRQEFKRFQAAPIIKLTSKSFGTGRRKPLVQNWTSNEIRNSAD